MTTPDKKLEKILYIDDEEWNLTAFKFMFRDEFEIHTVTETQQADQLLALHDDFDIIVSDQRMPGETGISFLERIRTTYPDSKRIVLTGYAEFDAVLDAINRAGIYSYLRKPWYEEEVRIVLRNAAAAVRTQKELLHSQARYRGLFENNSIAIAEVDATGHILLSNQHFSSILHATDDTPLVGQHLAQLFTGRLPFPPDPTRAPVELRFDGAGKPPTWLGCSPTPHDSGNYILACGDISESRHILDQIEFLAHHDSLTGLPNRVLCTDRMLQAMASADRDGRHVTLIFLDLDNFKTVNDSLGHQLGDKLLQQVGRRLLGHLTDTDTLCRYGGDEFLVILPDLPSPDASISVLNQLMHSLQVPFMVEGTEIATSISAGIVTYPKDGQDFDTLLRKADSAMYQAKAKGRNTYRFFDAQMNVDATENLRIRNGLHRALDQHEFVLHYQPQIALDSGRIIGVEALVRWQHPEQGLIPPGRFIPIAEDSGLIVTIGEWVLFEACRQAMAWRALGLPPLTMGVNLSVIQFRQGNVADTVRRALVETGLPPAQLDLELTESILMLDSQTNLDAIHQLKALGTQLSIDDFGTGYSSLAYLKRFAVDKLKIDQTFIRSLASDIDDQAIVRAIIQMAKSLNLKVIAEGVEDAAALERLRELGCQEVQGYYLARPMPATALEALLVSGQTLPVVIRSASSGLPPCDGMGRVSGFTPPPVGVHSF